MVSRSRGGSPRVSPEPELNKGGTEKDLGAERPRRDRPKLTIVCCVLSSLMGRLVWCGVLGCLCDQVLITESDDDSRDSSPCPRSGQSTSPSHPPPATSPSGGSPLPYDPTGQADILSLCSILLSLSLRASLSRRFYRHSSHLRSLLHPVDLTSPFLPSRPTFSLSRFSSLPWISINSQLRIQHQDPTPDPRRLQGPPCPQRPRDRPPAHARWPIRRRDRPRRLVQEANRDPRPSQGHGCQGHQRRSQVSTHRPHLGVTRGARRRRRMGSMVAADERK